MQTSTLRAESKLQLGRKFKRIHRRRLRIAMVNTVATSPPKKKRDVLEKLDVQRHEFLREFTYVQSLQAIYHASCGSMRFIVAIFDCCGGNRVMRRRAAMLEERALSAERRVEVIKARIGAGTQVSNLGDDSALGCGGFNRVDFKRNCYADLGERVTRHQAAKTAAAERTASRAGGEAANRVRESSCLATDANVSLCRCFSPLYAFEN